MATVVARYDYVDEEGNLLFQKERLQPKGFRQRRPCECKGKGECGRCRDRHKGWVYDRDGVRSVLYCLPEVLAAKERGEWILLVEGEKDADTLRKLGLVATTAPDGGGKSRGRKWRIEYTEMLRGARVAQITDTDWDGRRFAWYVMNELDGVVAELKGYEPLPKYKDITEQVEATGSYKPLVPFDRASVGAAVQKEDEKNREKHDVEIRMMTMDELMATPEIAEHDKLLDHLVLRGSRFIVGAYTGEGKTTLALQLLRTILRGDDFLGWNGLGNGTRALVIDVEQGRRTVKRRFKEACLHEYPDQVRLIWVPDGLSLDQNTRHVKRVEQLLAAGLNGGKWDVVIADPLYKLHQGNPNDERKAVDLMRQFDRWREAYGFALILPMHCRKPQPGVKFSIHDIAGSAAYTHGAEVIVGLQRVDKGFSHLHWWKDREGDLGCIGERWDLIHDKDGFHRDPRNLNDQPLWRRVRDALEARPGMSLEDLREATDAKQRSIRNALDAIGATHNGERLIKDQRWQMPSSLFDEEE